MVSEEVVAVEGELSFKGKAMKLDRAEDAEVIARAIRSTTNLRALRLEGNTIGLEAAKVIAEALKHKPEFEKAHWSDMFTGRLRAEIPPSLDSLGGALITAGAHLHELDLSDNAFGPDGVKGIRRLLVSSVCFTLKILRLNNNGLGIGGGKILSEAFIECHESSRNSGEIFSLKTFISGRNRLEDPGATALSKAFKVLGSLEEITMPQNGIRPAGIAALAEAFTENRELKVVNINDNTCTVSGAEALAKSLPSLHRLETLNVGDCLLKDAGAFKIAAGLATDMPSLREVIMSFNEIRTAGALAVVESMKRKDKLKVNGVNLDGNQLGEDGVADVEERMAAIGRIEALAPFNDNEEPDEDDDEDDDDKEEGEVDEDDDDGGDLSLDIKGMGLSSERQTDFMDEMRAFVESPSTKKWKHIPTDNRKHLLSEITKEILPNYEQATKIFVQVANVLRDDNDGLQIISDVILGSAYADARCKSSDIVSSLMVAMGLLKAESKIEKPVDLKGTMTALSCSLSGNYFPKEFASHFIAFLMKPNSLLDACQAERHILLQKLHTL